MVKKIIKLVNNEHQNTKIMSNKACGTGAYDFCYYTDSEGCMTYAYDVCGKDYKACTTGADDFCGNYDYTSCHGAGEEDTCDLSDYK